MNALDNEKDPFEDIFRDRFADFESETDSQLWHKIEPQLPVNPTRKMPYWQMSAVALIMLLSGIGVYYFSKLPEKSTFILSENTLKNKGNFIAQSSLKKSAVNEKLKGISIPERQYLKANLSPQLNLKVEEILSGKMPTSSDVPSQKNQVTSSNFSRNNGTVSENMILEESNAEKIVLGQVESQKKNRKNNKNIRASLNLLTANTSNESIVENYHEINENIFDVQGNKSPTLNVFNNNKRFSLEILDSKNYSLLSNNFKKPKLKNVLMPKVEEYFKESKPIDMYFSVMPLLNYYTITPNGNDANYVHGIAVNDDGDRLGFYTQGGVVFTLSDKFKIRTGLTFTKTNHSISYQIRTDSLVVQSPDNKGVDVSFAEINKTYSQAANYLGTKIELQYIFLRGEALTHYVNVGAEGAYRLNGNNQFNAFANFAYGVTRQIGDNAYLFIEPTFSYSLNQQSDSNAFLLVKPNKIGFNIGVNFKIK